MRHDTPTTAQFLSRDHFPARDAQPALLPLPATHASVINPSPADLNQQITSPLAQILDPCSQILCAAPAKNADAPMLEMLALFPTIQTRKRVSIHPDPRSLPRNEARKIAKDFRNVSPRVARGERWAPAH